MASSGSDIRDVDLLVAWQSCDVCVCVLRSMERNSMTVKELM